MTIAATSQAPGGLTGQHTWPVTTSGGGDRMMTDVPTSPLQITPHTMTSECHCEGSQLKYIFPYQFVINAMISILG